jgi:hypothetical protein
MAKSLIEIRRYFDNRMELFAKVVRWTSDRRLVSSTDAIESVGVDKIGHICESDVWAPDDKRNEQTIK